MSQSPSHYNSLSLVLSEVLEDIGVNEKSVMKRRTVQMIRETVNNIIYKTSGDNMSVYNLGSQAEGTTTEGLRSDIDILFSHNDVNVIQDWSEWRQNEMNLLMVKDQNVTPGYCFLQLLRSDEPLPEVNIPNYRFATDGKGKILHKNTCMHYPCCQRPDAVRSGPSLSVHGNCVSCDFDLVEALPCKSWPKEASHFVERQGVGKWRSPEMIRYAVSNGCFVVPVSSKISVYPELEWRISTSLAERCLMFNLNITQIQCYVLMKMILKSFLNHRKKTNLSSFMCKTVLLHCIENTEQSIWVKSNLYSCLTYCLLELHSCVQNGRCPHFIISGNNLMAGQFSTEMKRDLSRKIKNIIECEGGALLRIKIDEIGHRLKVKLTGFPSSPLKLRSHLQLHEQFSGLLYMNMATKTCSSLQFFRFRQLVNRKCLKKTICRLVNYYASTNRLGQVVCSFFLPFLYSTLGSVMASSSIAHHTVVSSEALNWLSAGLNSDVLSGRLKLASVLYCVGDIERAEIVLRQAETLYNSGVTVPVCGCRKFHHIFAPPVAFNRICSKESVDCLKNTTSFCVAFQHNEVNCVPREMQYEMMRYVQDNVQVRFENLDLMMKMAVVDSLPYLYFLQYKIYSQLRRYQDKRLALHNLAMSVTVRANFGHRETTLNLLGQCMEQQNKPKQALQCYLYSLLLRARHNAARFHICRLQAKYASGR